MILQFLIGFLILLIILCAVELSYKSGMKKYIKRKEIDQVRKERGW